MDTSEACIACQANKIAPTRGGERTIVNTKSALLQRPLGRLLSKPPKDHCFDKPIKITNRRVYKFKKKRGSVSVLHFSVKVFFCGINSGIVYIWSLICFGLACRASQDDLYIQMANLVSVVRAHLVHFERAVIQLIIILLVLI